MSGTVDRLDGRPAATDISVDESGDPAPAQPTPCLLYTSDAADDPYTV